VERLYGRTEAIARARQRLERAAQGNGGLLLFCGEPGIGKSRVAEELAARAAAEGASVAWGRCWEAGGAPPYWPWIQVFRDLHIDADPFAALTDDAAGDAEQARFQAFDLAVRHLKAAAARQSLVLVLDDLHAADVPSLLLLLLLARQLRGSRLLVVGAFREAEVRLLPAMAALLAKIAREGEVLPLGRLAPDDVTAWITEAWPRASAAQMHQLHRLTEGHPLFLVEALRLGAGAEAQRRVLEGLGAVLDERLGLLSPDTHDVLQVAAILGRDFCAPDVAAAADRKPDEVHHALREAATASIVLATDAPETWRFSHVLFRDRLYAELVPSARAALHWRAGTTLLARGQEPQTAVFHLFEGQAAGDDHRLMEVALAAAESSLRRLAFEDAAPLAERALQLPAAAGPPSRLACQLWLILGEAAIRLGEADRGKQACVRAAELARSLGADDLLVRAALVYGTDIASGSVDPTMVALLREALGRLEPGDSPLRARVTVRLAAALNPPLDVNDRAEIRSLLETSTAMARRLGDPHTLLHVLPFARAATGFSVPEQLRHSLIDETVQLARSLGHRLALLNSLPAYITTKIALGVRQEAEVGQAELEQLVIDFPQAHHQVRLRMVQAMWRSLDGDLDAADRLSTEARALIDGTGAGPVINLWLFHRFALAQLHGAPELVGDADAALLTRNFDTLPATMPFTAWLAAGTGRHEEARERLRAFTPDPGNLVGLMGAACCCVLLDDTDLGQRIYPLLVQASGDHLFSSLSPAALLGPLPGVVGDLAFLVGRVPEAIAHYDRAIAGAERLRARAVVERYRRARDTALAAKGAPQGRAPSRARRDGPPDSPPVKPDRPRLELHREGDVWAIASASGGTLRLKHSKGLGYLRYLLDQPGRDVHVLELVGTEHVAGDAGEVLDPRAKAEYRRRLDDLKDQLEEAERFADQARMGRIQEEIEAIADQLAGAVGLGGRDRRAASDVERARINVQRRVKDAIDRIAAADPALGRYLAAAVRTGTYCAYIPV
jgi:hypothetical protein